MLPPITRLTQILLWVLTAGLALTLLAPDIMVRWFALWPLADDTLNSPTSGFLPWQLITYAVVNGSMFNLVFSGLALWMIGSLLEQVWGQARYLNYLLACTLGAGVGQLLFLSFGILGASAPYAYGLSGVIYGLLMAFALLFPNMKIMLLIPPIPVRAQTLVIVLGVLSLVFGYLDPSQSAAHLGALGGPLAGWLLIRYWQGKPPFQRRGPRLVK